MESRLFSLAGVEVGEAFQTRNQLIAVGMRMEVGRSIRNDANAYPQTIHFCERDRLSRFTDAV